MSKELTGSLIRNSFFSALGVVVYIVILYGAMSFIERLSPGATAAPEILYMLTFLMTFVISAGVTGGLVIGKPIMLYLDNKKREAVTMFVANICWLVVFVLIAVILITLMR